GIRRVRPRSRMAFPIRSLRYSRAVIRIGYEGGSGTSARQARVGAIAPVTYRRIRIAWLGLALAVAACAGTFTRVPLPTVTSGEERAAGAAAGMLTLEQVERSMHENFYRIVYDEEGHSSGEPRAEFVSRMFASETISPTL